MKGITLIDHSGMEGFSVLQAAVSRRLRERGCAPEGLPEDDTGPVKES